MCKFGDEQLCSLLKSSVVSNSANDWTLGGKQAVYGQHIRLKIAIKVAKRKIKSQKGRCERRLVKFVKCFRKRPPTKACEVTSCKAVS